MSHFWTLGLQARNVRFGSGAAKAIGPESRPPQAQAARLTVMFPVFIEQSILALKRLTASRRQLGYHRQLFA